MKLMSSELGGNSARVEKHAHKSPLWLRISAVVACLATATAVNHGRSIVVDGLRAPTAQERLIEAVTERVFGSNYTVRCMSEQAMQKRWKVLHPFKKEQPMAGFVQYPTSKRIWLRSDMCDGISDFAAKPPQTEEGLNIEPMQGLFTLAHEQRHAAGTLKEAGANCEALQTVAELGVALGAPENLRGKMTYFVSTLISDDLNEHMRQGHKRAEPYLMDSICTPDSIYDMHAMPADQFPWPPNPANNS